MKKLLIYSKNQYDERILLRSIRITNSFIGIGSKGQVNIGEFKKLASDLEPTMTSFELLDI